MQLGREGSPPPGLRPPQAKLSRNSNEVARGRILWFESYMASHAVGLREGRFGGKQPDLSAVRRDERLATRAAIPRQSLFDNFQYPCCGAEMRFETE